MTHDPFAVTNAGHMGAKGYAGGAEMDPKTHYPAYEKAKAGGHGGAGGAIEGYKPATLPAGQANMPKDDLIFYHPSDAADQMQTPNGLTSPIAAELDPKLKPHDASSYAQPPVKGDADAQGKPGRVDPTL